MRANRACLAALLTVFAACGGGSSGSDSFVPPATNLRLAAVDLWGAGELRVAGVAESDDGRDGNGDGDALDVLAIVLDLTDGSRHDLGLALDDLRMPVAGDVLAALFVAEQAQGATDLNGDGDANDAVLHVFDARTDLTTNSGLAGVLPAVGAGLVAFGADELEQGQDFDGDGQANSFVFHVYDSRTGLSTNLTRRLNSAIVFEEHEFMFTTDEVGPGDLNGDGDADDSGIFQLFDLTLGGIVTLPVEIHDPPHGHEEEWYALVDESGQGADLNGDGDQLDGVFHRLDPHLGQITSLGLSSTVGRSALRGVGSQMILYVQEIDGVDRNGDGDFDDTFTVAYDTEQHLAFETGLQLTTSPAFLGERIGVSLSELEEGADHNGDGDQDDLFVQLIEPGLGTVTDLGLESPLDLRAAGARLVLALAEAGAGTDWNGDGDTLDTVLFVHDPADGSLSGTGHAVLGVTDAVSPARLLLRAQEGGDGRDLNGDGDELDEVYVLYDIAGKTSTNLRLAGASFPDAPLTAGGRGAFLVSEFDQGRDLNGDGDRDDRVVFTLQ